MKGAIHAVLSILIAWSLITLTSCQNSTLFHNGQSDYAIVVCKNASVSEQTAAKELQGYLKQVGGVELPIIEKNQLVEGQKHIFIGYNKEYGSKYGVERPEAQDEAYTYRTVGENIWIYGGSERGTMYGVYSFLENELGVRWYTKDFTLIPSLKKWKVKELSHSEEPFIQHRQIGYNNVLPHKDWLAHNKCNMMWGAQDNEYGGLESYWGAHTFELFIPSGVYFKDHPEYFSMRDGERKPYTQLCLTNPDVLKICIEKMKQTIAENPHYWVYSMSQSDNQFPCQCEKCRAIEEQYGGHSGLIVWFVNQVADAIRPLHPDKYIGTFAYQYTRKAPKGIVPRDNVVIRLCSIECCFAHPLEECEHNKSFISDIEDWSKIAPQLVVWDYVINYRQYVAPFPNFGVLAKNIKTFKKYKAIGVQEEAQYQSLGGEFSDMRAWVLSKLLWNPDLDTSALVNEFIENYYGDAAPYIKEYFDITQSLVKDDTVMGIYIDERNSIYTDEYITKAYQILNNAQQSATKADEETQKRVDLVKLQVDFLHMMRNPEQAVADGAYDRVKDITARYGVKLCEWVDNDVFMNIYDVVYLKNNLWLSTDDLMRVFNEIYFSGDKTMTSVQDVIHAYIKKNLSK
ncbi:MAG: DUF4838 domain-containing protein [Alistipes sp.]|nr:DUF4838 domain-containing protein [Alistipes sp.]